MALFLWSPVFHVSLSQLHQISLGFAAGRAGFEFSCSPLGCVMFRTAVSLPNMSLSDLLINRTVYDTKVPGRPSAALLSSVTQARQEPMSPVPGTE